MAAIKRSQANQRRQPETFHLYQQLQQQNQSSLSCVKVELKHFILSILDDPIVSRVFGEAGFRSCDIKLAIVHPPLLSRFPGSRRPPLFLSNSTSTDSNRPSFNFPFAGFPEFENADENCRRIAEVLVNKKGRNPLLIGACANDALANFTDCVHRGRGGVLPAEIDGLSLISIGKEICDSVTKGESHEIVGMKFEELGDMVERCSGPGIVVNYGDLKVFDDDKADVMSQVVSELNNLLRLHNGKLWLMGAAGSYETYMKFLARFPSIERDWDLHPLPITSSKSSIGGSYSKSSLMGSFIPFGGFFSTPSELKNLSGSTTQSITRCEICNEKCEQEISVILKGGSTVSISDQFSASLSSWLQVTECNTSKRVDEVKAKDDRTVLNAKLMGLQRKWNDICHRLHCTQPFRSDISQVRSQVPGAPGFHFFSDGNESSSKESSLDEGGCGNLNSFLPVYSQKISPTKEKVPMAASQGENVTFQPKLPVEVSKNQLLEMGSPWPPSYKLPLDRTSSTATVTTDLGLGTIYASGDEAKKPSFQDHQDQGQYFLGSISAEFDRVGENASDHIIQSLSHSVIELGRQLDAKDFKSLRNALAEKVGWQEEAVCAIGQTVSNCRAGHGRRHGCTHKGDIWLSFLGPDKVGKKKIAAALAEIISGSRESLVSVDLSSEDGIRNANSIFDSRDLNHYDVTLFRGKTVIDYVANELSKKPHSVVLLENIDKADFLSQSCLSRAIRTGKFPDSHGREISIHNTIFLTTSRATKVNKSIISGRNHVKFSEERILEAKGWKMKILVRCVAGSPSRTIGTNVLVMPSTEASISVSLKKRKLHDNNDSTEQDSNSETPTRVHKALKSCLDLNVPVKEMEENDHGNSDSDCASENSEAWLEDFFDQVDKKVIFKPFDFDGLAEELLKEISLCFQKSVGSEALLEVDPEVMVQMLAAAWLSDGKRAVKVWMDQVLSRSFMEARQRVPLTNHSVVKLIPCEGLLLTEEQAPGVCLPARIILN